MTAVAAGEIVKAKNLIHRGPSLSNCIHSFLWSASRKSSRILSCRLSSRKRSVDRVEPSRLAMPRPISSASCVLIRAGILSVPGLAIFFGRVPFISHFTNFRNYIHIFAPGFTVFQYAVGILEGIQGRIGFASFGAAIRFCQSLFQRGKRLLKSKARGICCHKSSITIPENKQQGGFV